IPNAGRVANVGRRVGRVVTQAAHQRVENAATVAREQIDGRAVRGETDGHVDIGKGALPRRSAETAAEPSPEGAMVVGGPGIEDAGVDNGEGAGNHRRTELGIPD